MKFFRCFLLAALAGVLTGCTTADKEYIRDHIADHGLRQRPAPAADSFRTSGAHDPLLGA